MANGSDERHRHFILEGVTETEAFRSRGGGGRPPIPRRNRAQHGGALLQQVDELRTAAAYARETQQDAGLEDGLGLQVEFESFPDIQLAFESLARERQGIELLNVRQEKDRTHATVFVPDGKLDHFEGLIRDYLAERRNRAGHPRDNQRLIDAISQIRAASLQALWTDDHEAFPSEDAEQFWWEVWLPVRGERQVVIATFRRLAEAQGMETAPGELIFPERTVLLVRTSAEQMQRSILTLNSIAELRRAKETADFFDSLRPEEQREWLDDLLARTRFSPDGDEVPHVCLLDTGVNRGHGLLAPALAVDDLHTIEPAWGSDDIDGHGTQMAGLALAGNSQRGAASRYRYASHGLRFDVKRPPESINAFRSRINAAARDEEEGTARSQGDPAWLIGAQNRHRGSLHGDIWRGNAADLASRECIAVYPALGWWRSRPKLERYDQAARYALIVSIRAPETDIDLYTAVANRIGALIAIET